MKSDGAIDAAGGKHVNGKVETEGIRGHGAGWYVPGDPASHGRVAVEDGLDSCFRCHSAKEPSTNGIRTCASCHDALAGGGDWTTSCIGCHGSATSSAPPRDVHGNIETTAIGVGAHRAHVLATSGVAPRYDCTLCHEKPAVVFAPGHLDGSTTVTGYTGTDARFQFVKDPGWNLPPRPAPRPGATVDTAAPTPTTATTNRGSEVAYRVNYAGAARDSAVDPGERHAGHLRFVPRSASRRSGTGTTRLHGGTYSACDLCHFGVTSDGRAFTDNSRHVNGVVEVTPRWISPCFNCH